MLNYIALSDELPPYLLMDKEVVKEKVSVIGKNIKNSKVFMLLRLIPMWRS